MSLFFFENATSDLQSIELSKIQAHLLYEHTKDMMLEIDADTGLMWQMNYETSDYLSFDGADNLTPKQYRIAFDTVVKACETVPELRDVYEPIKTSLMLDPRFQAA